MHRGQSAGGGQCQAEQVEVARDRQAIRRRHRRAQDQPAALDDQGQRPVRADRPRLGTGQQGRAQRPAQPVGDPGADIADRHKVLGQHTELLRAELGAHRQPAQFTGAEIATLRWPPFEPGRCAGQIGLHGKTVAPVGRLEASAPLGRPGADLRPTRRHWRVEQPLPNGIQPARISAPAWSAEPSGRSCPQCMRARAGRAGGQHRAPMSGH